MLKVVRWYNGVPRAEINQRARDTRLRLERIKRLLAPRAAVTDPGSGGPFVFLASAYTAKPGKVIAPKGR